MEVFPASDGTVYLLRPCEPDLAIESAAEVDVALLRLLQTGAHDIGTLSAALPTADVEEKLAALNAAGLLARVEDHGLSATDAARFDRQLPYLSEIGDDGMRRLRKATVVVLGCGGLGTWTLAGLVSLGLGRLVLVDDDRIELSNLNRQILYSPADLGRSKAMRAAAWVRRFDPSAEIRTVVSRVESPESIARIVAGANATVLAADWPPYELGRWVNEACVAEGVPFIMAGQVPPLLKVGPFYLPGESACFACHEHHLRQLSPLYDEIVALRRAEERPAVTLGPASGVVGSLLALELLQLLAGDSPPATRGRAMLIDMRTLESRWEEIPRYADCGLCREAP